MAGTLTILSGFSFNGEHTLPTGSAQVDITVDVLTYISEEIPAGAVNYHIEAAIDINKLVGFGMVGVGGHLTVKTNSTGAPNDQFSLVDGVAQTWDGTGDPPLSATVANLYITNSGTAAVQFDLRAGMANAGT